MSNNSSIYVSSLISFLLETKPYHSKLTEAIEELQLSDICNIKINERLFIKTKTSSNWLYNYFSAGNELFRNTILQKIQRPSFLYQTYKVGTDENTDFSLVPFTYSKKSFEGLGPAEVFIHHDNRTDALVESVDYFTSYGGYQFQIKQLLDTSGNFNPSYINSTDSGLISSASSFTRELALDTSNPLSAINKIKAILDDIQLKTTLSGGDINVQQELDLLYTILLIPDIPKSYEALFSYLSLSSSINVDITSSKNEILSILSPLLFNAHGDTEIRESGMLSYIDIQNDYIKITNIIPNLNSDFEEWSIISIDAISPRWKVLGSNTGFVGFLDAGSNFSVNRISFNTEHLSQAPIGVHLELTPERDIVIKNNIPLETWSIIKVNPIAHDRPQFIGVKYGTIQNLNGDIGVISILDSTLLSSTLVLTARIGGQLFDLRSTSDSYTTVITVNEIFNDGKIGLKLIPGTSPFSEGDRFFIQIQNDLASSIDLDLSYGYDLDSYDNEHLGFLYDTRFTNYDLSSINLRIAEDAPNGRKFRIQAIPTGTPVATLKKDGSGPSYSIDLTDGTTGIAPDPSLTSIPIYSMLGDSNTAPDLNLFYTSEFIVQFSDDNFSTYTNIGTATVGTEFNSNNIQFTIVPGSIPFVAVQTDDGVQGGDIFSFSIQNKGPFQVNIPSGINAKGAPRLTLHSGGFYDAPNGKVQVLFSSSSKYSVSIDDNTPVYAELNPLGLDSQEGYSFKNIGIQFTVVPGNGLTAGDKFIFNTFTKKPTYLVHGSVTGWTAPATVGEYYWNGYIGFKLNKPEYRVFVNNINVQASDVGLNIFKIRNDILSSTYHFIKDGNDYLITNSISGELRRSSGGAFFDDIIDISLSGIVDEFILQITAHPFPLGIGNDLIIINISNPALFPINNDTIIIRKAENGEFSIGITPGNSDVSSLHPIIFDPRFIDSNQPINTSPETVILRDWIPLKITGYDSNSSIAEFSDKSIILEVTASGTNLPIGILNQNNNIFEWDNTFFNTYLPLNTEANLVITGTGTNEKIHVKLSESLKLLLDAGPLAESFEFIDTSVVNITEANFNSFIYNSEELINTDIQDSPFIDFQPGYANVPFDITGYDTGEPLNIISLLTKIGLSNQERQNILDLWDNFLLDKQEPTTAEQWAFLYSALATDPNPDGNTSEFGYPTVGFGIDTNSSEDNIASSSIQDIIVLKEQSYGYPYDSDGYDIGGLDDPANEVIMIFINSLPSIPTSIPTGTTYETLETPLYSSLPGRVFEIVFNSAPTSPVFSIWLPGSSSTIPVISFAVSSNRYRFSISTASELKIIVT